MTRRERAGRPRPYIGEEQLGMTNAETKRFPGQSVSRILSKVRFRFTPEGFIPEPSHLCGHLSGPAISRRLGAANPGLRRNEPLLVPAWPCSWRGLPVHGHCCPCRWSLTPPFHPYLRLHCLQQAATNRSVRRYVSVARSGRFPRPGSFPGAMLCGVRTFLCY